MHISPHFGLICIVLKKLATPISAFGVEENKNKEAIFEANKIDGIGLSKDEETLVLFISDHFDWSNEYKHLVQLQNKLNYYIIFLESHQYKEIYSNKEFHSYSVEIHFMHKPTDNCIKFLDIVNKQLSGQKININVVFDDSETFEKDSN